MPSSLLATKLYIPLPYQDVVDRSRLYSRLNAGLRGKLTLVSAPAGFGKTTLVAGWVEYIRFEPNGPRVSWLSLDEDDNLPVSFWTYVIAALQTVNSAIGEAALSAFQSPQPTGIESVLASLINDVAGQAAPILLVIDDYHVIRTPEIHAALDFFIDHLPRNLLLVMVTREDPPLALSRLRVRGQLAEVRAADLRFSEPETGEFLNQLMALNLAEGEVSALSERTEGWIAGLRLAALSLQSESDKQRFIDAFTASHRFLTDYLVDEVLSRQDSVLRLFLQRTSILNRFSAELCDEVLSIDEAGSAINSQQTLRRLEQANLFLVPLDNDRKWFRYHHLFAQFLRLRLHELEAGLIPQLYQRAIDWCSAQGLDREALVYAFEVHDDERAAALIERLSPDVLTHEGPALVLQWVSALPDSLVRRRPMLCVQYAWALTFAGKMKEAYDYLAIAETLVSQNGSLEESAIAGYIAAHRAYILFFQGEYRQTIDYAKKALALLPAEDNILRARTAAFLGNGLRYAGDLSGAAEILAQAISLSEWTGNVYTTNLCYTSLAELYIEQGLLREAMAVYQQTLAYTQRQTSRRDIPYAGFAYLGIGRIEREWDHLETARTFIDQGIALCKEWRQADVLVIGLMERAFLHQDLGEFDLARQDLTEAREIVAYSPWGLAMVDAFLARVDLASGDLSAAARWMERYGVSIDGEHHFEQIAEYLQLMRVLISQGHFEDGLAVLEKLEQDYRPVGRDGRLLEVLMWKARAFAGLGNRPKALETLGEALSIGERGNYLRSFLEVGPVIADLTESLLHQAAPSAYLDRLLEVLRSAFPEEGRQPASQNELPQAEPSHSVIHRPAEEGQADNLIEPLNERELEILRLLSAGLSNNEIGAELYLSVNTIRWYASQIYLKLGVSGRGAAVARARALGILK